MKNTASWQVRKMWNLFSQIIAIGRLMANVNSGPRFQCIFMIAALLQAEVIFHG